MSHIINDPTIKIELANVQFENFYSAKRQLKINLIISIVFLLFFLFLQSWILFFVFIISLIDLKNKNLSYRFEKAMALLLYDKLDLHDYDKLKSIYEF